MAESGATSEEDQEPDALTREGDVYYDGYWQHEEYFCDIRKDILALYRFPDFDDVQSQEAAQLAINSNSCAIHIRRGDYLKDPLRKGTTTLEYPLKKAVLPESQTYYVNWNQGERSIHDMHLMSLCQNHIIANSSFSWWGAWLSQRNGKTVVAPAVWMNRDNVCSPVPQKWIKIK